MQLGKKEEKRLRQVISDLIAKLRAAEEALARANYENATLRSQIAELKAEIGSQKRKLDAIRDR